MALQLEKVRSIFSTVMNPLRGLTKPQIERLLIDMKHGNDAVLQGVFSEIEIVSPIYQVCIQKRVSGVLNRKWAVETLIDTDAAIEQKKYVEDVLYKSESRNVDGLTDALTWLVLANFKGRAAIKPFMTDAGELILKPLQNWNLLYWNGEFFWNPTAEQCGWMDDGKPKNIIPIPNSEICYLLHDRPIDVPGLMIYLRQLIGEDQWSRFVEKEGVPQVVITAPEGTPDTALDAWNMRAMQIFEGGSGTMPPGAHVDFLTAARGQDPFTSYIQHQMEMISILATGGTLMTIGGSTGLGSDLASVQKKSFDSLVNNDCKRIANAFSQIINKIVKFRNKKDEVLVRFSFMEDSEYTTKDYIEMATQLNAIGVKIDKTKFKEITKLEFIDDTVEEWTPSTEEKEKQWTPDTSEEGA